MILGKNSFFFLCRHRDISSNDGSENLLLQRGNIPNSIISVAQDMFNVNFFGTVRLTKAVLPSMKARQSGHIIDNSSVSGIMGIPFLEIYSASKSAAEGLSESLAPRLKQFNIR